MTDDADYVLVGQGTIAMPARVIVRRLREQGHKVGFCALKWFRPFPADEVVARAEPLQGRRRSSTATTSFGSPHHGGVLFTEFRAAFYDSPKRPAMINIHRRPGRPRVHRADGQEMFNLMQQGRRGRLKTNVHWIGVRE